MLQFIYPCLPWGTESAKRNVRINGLSSLSIPKDTALLLCVQIFLHVIKHVLSKNAKKNVKSLLCYLILLYLHNVL